MVDVTNKLLDSPEYFFCERFRCKLRISVCLGRQRANAERRPIDPIPYADCLDCEQGRRNQASCKPCDGVKGKPVRGRGERKEDCEHYEDCLSFAARRDWKTFTCSQCPLNQKEEGVMAETKKVNTRICETLGCGKVTLNTNCPLCASCMAKRRNNKGVENGKAAVENKGVKTLMPSQHPPEILQPRGDTEVKIDFSKHTGLFESLSAIADREFRPVELQILFMLKSYLDKSEGRGGRLSG